jgi:hypothetical protein
MSFANSVGLVGDCVSGTHEAACRAVLCLNALYRPGFQPIEHELGFLPAQVNGMDL